MLRFHHGGQTAGMQRYDLTSHVDLQRGGYQRMGDDSVVLPYRECSTRDVSKGEVGGRVPR